MRPIGRLILQEIANASHNPFLSSVPENATYANTATGKWRLSGPRKKR